LVIYALCQFGLAEDERIRKAASFLADLGRENGWPCAVSREMGKFRGPGSKDDPCPYANLLMLKALAWVPGWLDSSATRAGAEAALTLWEESWRRHPYLFRMGDDFRKLKAPFVWYDILHALDVLSRFPWLLQDPRLREMLALVLTKADDQGRFTPESVWTSWKDWEFGQKKQPSRWVTLLAWRIFKRVSPEASQFNLH
jgi:hypothetical protein